MLLKLPALDAGGMPKAAAKWAGAFFHRTNNMNPPNYVIGFLGLGAMGSRIVKRIMDAGFKVVVFDRTREKAEAMATQ